MPSVTIVGPSAAGGVYRSVDYYYDRGQLVLVWLRAHPNGITLHRGQLNRTSHRVDHIHPIAADHVDLSGASSIAVNRFVQTNPTIYVSYADRNAIQQFALIDGSLQFTRRYTAMRPASIVVDANNGSFISWLAQNHCIWAVSVNGEPNREPNSEPNREPNREPYREPYRVLCEPADTEIKSLAVAGNFYYFLRADGRVYQCARNNHTDCTTPRLLIPRDAYTRGTRFSYTDRAPATISVSERDAHLDVYVSDKHHHVIFHFKLIANGTDGYLLNRSDILTSERYIADFRLIRKQPVTYSNESLTQDTYKSSSAISSSNETSTTMPTVVEREPFNLPNDHVRNATTTLPSPSDVTLAHAKSSNVRLNEDLRNIQDNEAIDNATKSNSSSSNKTGSNKMGSNEIGSNETRSNKMRSNFFMLTKLEPRDSEYEWLWYTLVAGAGAILVLLVLVVSCKISRAIFSNQYQQLLLERR